VRTCFRTGVLGFIAFAMLVSFAGTSYAQDATEDRLRALEERLREQENEIGRLREQLAGQQEVSDSLESALDGYLGKVEDEAWWSEPDAVRVSFSKGLRFKTVDGSVSLKLGGRIMDDWAWFDPDDDVEEEIGSFENMVEFRRARLYLSGTIWENTTFKAQYDFGGGDADFKDVWLGLKNVPLVGNVRVGNQKVPFSLEELTSSKYLTFMERSLPNAFAPGRQNGIQFHDSAMEGNLFWAFGLFHETDGYGDGAAGKNFAVRVAGTPVNEDKGKTLVHVGVAYFRMDPTDDMLRVRARPEAHATGTRIINTGKFMVDSANLVGLEGAFVYGPFSLQTEYMWMSTDASEVDDPTLTGFYLYGSFFLTGESRKYKGGSFSRVSPNDPFHYDDGGPGAWELTARYSTLDFDDGDLFESSDGGEVSNFTIGLNWYLNPNTRVMVNYVVSDADGIGDVSVFQMRFQIDF